MRRLRVLCVDDEPNVLEGLTLHLRRKYHVSTAASGEEGLSILSNENDPIDIILSDMRMPGMDGATFLGKAQQCVPQTIRMLLTGQTDLNAAIKAVNEGQIFRFLTKPCPPDQLLKSFEAASEQRRLILAEKELLEETLQGSIRALIDILSMSNPLAFGRASRIKRYVCQLAESMELKNRWAIELAAMFSQLAVITLPNETVENLYYGKALSPQENTMIESLPHITEQLLAHIPRLEPVREILASQRSSFVQKTSSKVPPVGAQLLRIAHDYDELETQGMTPQKALNTMQCREGIYNPELFRLFSSIRGGDLDMAEICKIPLRAIQAGMVILEDIRSYKGALILARGYEVTASFLERIKHFPSGFVKEPLKVMVSKKSDDSSSGTPDQTN